VFFQQALVGKYTISKAEKSMWLGAVDMVEKAFVGQHVGRECETKRSDNNE
jgi:hypothetical protein